MVACVDDLAVGGPAAVRDPHALHRRGSPARALSPCRLPAPERRAGRRRRGCGRRARDWIRRIAPATRAGPAQRAAVPAASSSRGIRSRGAGSARFRAGPGGPARGSAAKSGATSNRRESAVRGCHRSARSPSRAAAAMPRRPTAARGHTADTTAKATRIVARGGLPAVDERKVVDDQRAERRTVRGGRYRSARREPSPSACG